MPSLEIIGSFAVNAGTSRETLLPILRGSRAIFDPNISTPSVASNVFGAVNRKQGFYKPQILLRTVLHSNWFTVSNLLTLINRSTNTGQLLTDMGVVQWTHAGQTPRCFARAKVASLTFSWMGDAPVFAEMVILPYYGAIAPRRTGRTVPFGRVWGSHRVSYGGGLTQVQGGSLQIRNNLRYSETSPWGDSYDGHRYCPEIWNDMLAATVAIRQYTGAAGNIVATNDGLSLLKVAFNGWGSERVTFSTWVRQPREVDEHQGGVAAVDRFYEGQVPSANTRMVQVNVL